VLFLLNFSHFTFHLSRTTGAAFLSILRITANSILLTMVWRARDSPAYSGGDTSVAWGLVGLIRSLGLDEGKQALIFLSGAKELEGDAASTHRMDHRGQFKRGFPFIKRQLQIEDVVLMDLRLAPDDTAAYREIEHRSLTSNLAPGK
jgi:hypothetical protein